jgi:signal transduction histidine kinase
MVESILHVMRQGRSQEEAGILDAASIVQTVCDQFTDMGHAVHLRACERAALRAHADEFQRVLTNLVDNAVRYAGGAEVSLIRAGGKIVVLVEDEGPGIPQASKASVLLPFVRGEAACRKEGDNGLGLGLSIAREIVTAQGGTLSLLDRAPRGLTVRIELPAAVAREQELAGAA